MEIVFDESTHKFFGTISMLVADNLAAHAIGGFYQNFSTVQRFCRFCNRVKASISDISIEDEVRTKAAYDVQLIEVEKNPDLSKLYGIKQSSAFNELKYYHIMDGCPADLAHGVFEGFANDFLTDVTVVFIRGKILTLAEINDIIINFNYAEFDKSNKPQIIKEKPLTQLRIKQTACEMWNLIRLYPVMFGKFVESGNLHWDVVTLFAALVEKLCATMFSESEITVLENIIENFFKKLLDVFPDTVLKPKAHFISHYPMLIRKFGPVVKTLRFESKHHYFKSSIACSRNRVNVCKSMAVHHQMMSYLNSKQEF